VALLAWENDQALSSPDAMRARLFNCNCTAGEFIALAQPPSSRLAPAHQQLLERFVRAVLRPEVFRKPAVDVTGRSDEVSALSAPEDASDQTPAAERYQRMAGGWTGLPDATAQA